MDRSFYGRREQPREDEATRCPECGEELGYHDEIYTRELTSTVAGCSQCLHRHNAVEWLAGCREEWLAEGW